MLEWLSDHWIWVTFFVASNAIAGFWTGLGQYFGDPNPIRGYLKFRADRAELDELWNLAQEANKSGDRTAFDLAADKYEQKHQKEFQLAARTTDKGDLSL